MNKMHNYILYIVAACILLNLPACNKGDEPQPQQFVTSYIDSADWGLKLLSLEMDPLRLETIYILKTKPVPAYFETHPSKKYFYMVSSDPLPGKESGGSVYAYRIVGDFGGLEYINSVSSYGEGPCHIVFDRTGKFAFVANYGSGDFSLYPLNEDGSIGDSIHFIQFSGSSVNPKRQNAPHAHSSLLSYDNNTLYVADLGTDRVMAYAFDAATGNMKPAFSPWISTVPGAGPRHMALHPEIDILYIAEELSSSVEVCKTGMSTDSAASVIQQISTLPVDFSEQNFVAGIRISRDGKYVYVSNRGHNSIAIFSVDPADGSLKAAGHQSTQGNWPRNFTLSENEEFLLAANQRSNNIVVFKRNPGSGSLSETGLEMSLPGPKCLKKFPKNP